MPLKKKNTAKFSTATRYDGRPSAIALGGLGIAILVTTFSFIIILDLPTLVRDLRQMKSNIGDFFKKENDTDLAPPTT